MSTVVNKADPSNFRTSANTPDFPPAEWLINPPGFVMLFDSVPSRYWKLTVGGDDIEEMNQAEKDALDAAEAAAVVVANKLAASDEADEITSAGRRTRAILNMVRKQFNVLRALHGLPNITVAQVKTDYKNEVNGE